MTTARDMMQASLEKLGVYAPGETMVAADEERMLSLLNQMMDSWSNEALTCYAILEQSHALVVNQQSFTIGPGGDVNGPRPIRIITGPGAAYLLDSNGNRYTVDALPRDRWNQIWNLQKVNSNLPDTIFYDPQFPLGVMNVYPLYNGTLPMTLFWDSYLQLTEFANLQTALSLPPGYEKAIIDNLAIEAAPYFKPDNWQVPPLLMKQASESKGNVKRSNIRENIAVYDRVLIQKGNAVWNPYSDGYPR